MDMEIHDSRLGKTHPNSLRDFYIQQNTDDKLLVRLIGPTKSLRWIDFKFDVGEELPEWETVFDSDLVARFDKGMDVGAWFDLLAERYPEYEWAADAYGKIMVACGRTHSIAVRA